MSPGKLEFRAGALPVETARLRGEVRRFITEERDAGRIEVTLDSWLGKFDAAFSARLGEKGWLGMTWPKAYGGHERTQLERFVVVEELLAQGAPVAAHWVADRQTGPMLLRFGTERQREEFLPRMAAGRCFFAIGMSEPDSGSDLASVSTRGVREDENWIISGTKVWTSSAHEAHQMIALVRTGTEGATKHEGLSQFIIDLDAPGVTIRPIKLLTGEHHFNEVVFDDVVVPHGRLVGEEGAGWEQVTSELAFERSGPERFLSVLPLLEAFLKAYRGEMDAVQREALGRMVAKLWCIRQMSISVAVSLSEGLTSDTQAALVKDMGTSFEQELVEVVRTAVADHAEGRASGELKPLLDFAVMRSPGFTLRGGTNEILRVIIARGLGL